MKPFIVAAAQTETVAGDLAANLAAHRRFIDEARGRGVQLLVFPELSLAGHSAGADALRLALPRNAAALLELAEACSPLAAVVGFVEEAAGAQFYNSVATLYAGRVVHVHRKIALATYGRLDDGKHYGHGARLDQFTLPADPRWQIATPVCADLWSPAVMHRLACDGATLCAAPVSSAVEAVGDAFDNPRGWDTVLRAHALVYGLPVVFANRVGHENGLRFWGGSRVVGPRGETLAQSESAREELVVATLDYEAVRAARFDLPTLRDARGIHALESGIVSVS
ncbi:MULTISPECIES: nitrilase-related carbon-nitrogen hydrolase [unclassified Caballeronia]|uniref:nitrilase-related carbon-nitrogen hydrolase n=1 Tax=unclassified Caballeronia TaxID=2646786 RepID=UPI001FD1C24A|nr:MULTISPECIES: nitrilase-related carbon-nitrogen hydrolase [unclassified Caballeronia]MDR5777205.1 nitrilase-related carbon-nitrogen hydrolase [Caballeronia sp. LZ002]MDR5852643.1 nitrilase-related carbon-nitrogen hydrolase [Caballeronia sp. LZ003]